MEFFKLVCIISSYLLAFTLLQLLTIDEIKGDPSYGRGNHMNNGLPRCKKGEQLVRKEEGMVCRRCPRGRCNTNNRHGSRFNPPSTTQAPIPRAEVIPPRPTISNYHLQRISQLRQRRSTIAPIRRSVILKADLPKLNGRITSKEEACLQTNRVYWPHDGECHALLQRGPCAGDEWLILHGDLLQGNANDINIACAKRPCPCTRSDSYLCEILTTTKKIDCGVAKEAQVCMVAMAAEQDRVCGTGEQLLLTPFGDGICECRLQPLHTRWPADGKCYSLFDNGQPCLENQTLQFSPTANRAVCVASLCKPGFVLYMDGRCYIIDTQGPCNNMSKLGIDPASYELACIPNPISTRRSKRSLYKFRGRQGRENEFEVTPAECKTDTGKCSTVNISFNNTGNLLVDDTEEIPCDEILCDDGYVSKLKPEGCKCVKERSSGRPKPLRNPATRAPVVLRPNRPFYYTTNTPVRRNRPIYPRTTTKKPIRIANTRAKSYLIWLHNFVERRRQFNNKVMGRL